MNNEAAMYLHAGMSALALIALVVLQALGHSSPDLFALLGGIAGGSGVAGYTHSLYVINGEHEGK